MEVFLFDGLVDDMFFLLTSSVEVKHVFGEVYMILILKA